MRHSIKLLLIACLMPLPCLSAESVAITHAWARATVPGQTVGAVYMDLQSATDATLTEVSSPVADSAELHLMSMNKGVMEMRMLKSLPLPAGKVVKLEPSGLHVMLFDLKKPLKTGEQVDLTLKIQDKAGKTSTQQLHVPVRKSKD